MLHLLSRVICFRYFESGNISIMRGLRCSANTSEICFVIVAANFTSALLTLASSDDIVSVVGGVQK